MKKHLISLAFATLLLPGALTAGDWGSLVKGIAPLAAPTSNCHACLSYYYIDLEYLTTDYGTPHFDDGRGYGIGFSKSLSCNFLFTGSFADSSYDCDWIGHIVPVETQRFRLGLGTRVSIGECVDLTFEGGAQHLDAEFGDGYSDHDYDS